MKNSEFSNKSLKRAKALLTVLLFVVLCLCLFAVSACNKHEHAYTSEVTKQPTCSEKGEITYTCECGDSYTEKLDLVDHDYSAYTIGVNNHWVVCKFCNAVSPTDNEPHPHNYTIAVSHKDPSCVEAGEEVKGCVCGAKQTTLLHKTDHELEYATDDTQHWQKCKNCSYVTEKVNHEHNTYFQTVKSSCTVKGHEDYKCVCGHISSTELPLANHELVYKTSDTQHWQECRNCEYATEKVSHDYDSEVTAQPTCTKTGTTTYTCECGKTYTEDIDKIPHNYEFHPTPSNHWKQCTMCNSVDPENPKTEHTWVVTGVKKAATCTDDGYNSIKCTVCEYESTRLVSALGHDTTNGELGESHTQGHYLKCHRCEEFVFVDHDKLTPEQLGADCDCPSNKAPTCGTAGHQDKACLVCGKAVHTHIPATGEHNFDKTTWQINGVYHWYVCTNCDAKADEAQHNFVSVKKEPTCTEKGYERSVCSECNYQRSNRNIDALGHDEKRTEIKAATCTAEGSEQVTCTRCDLNETVTLPMIDHDWHGEYDSTSEGHIRTCAICGTKKGKTYTAHNYINDEDDVKAATPCEQEYTFTYTCSVCGYTRQSDPKLKKHDTEWLTEGQKDSTCTELGGHWEKCKNCDYKEWVSLTKLAAHDPFQLLEKQPTLEEDGHQKCFQCANCKRYFRTKNCEERIPDEEAVYPKIEVASTVADMETAVGSLAVGASSRGLYQIEMSLTARADEIVEFTDTNNVTLMLELNINDDLSFITLGTAVTLRGNILKENDGVTLTNVRVVSVNVAEKYSLFYEVVDETDGKVSCFAGINNDPFKSVTPGTNTFGILSNGDTIVFNFKKLDYSKPIYVKSAVVNGKPVTVSNEVYSMTVATEDVHAKFVLSYGGNGIASTSLTIQALDTSTNQKVAIDPYLSSAYTNGTPNEYGRLYAGSKTTFSVENAKITSIKFRFEDPIYYRQDEYLDLTTDSVWAGDSLSDMKCVTNSEMFTSVPGNEVTYYELSLKNLNCTYVQLSAAIQTRIVWIELVYSTSNQL